MVHKHLSICIRIPYVKEQEDFYEIVNEKMNRNEVKYPVNKSKGKADKYDKRG